MSGAHLVLGLDGLDLDLMQRVGEAQLPTLFRVMREGVYARQESVQPPATLPNWTTFLTGRDPGDHGVFDFTTRHGYGVRFSGGTVREAPTIFPRLDAMGLRTACLFFPATYPPERLEHGVFISGWDAPVAFEADDSFVWPPTLYENVKARFGAHRFDDVDEFDAERPGWHGALPGALEARVARKVELAEWLLGRESWDAFAIYFGESDTAAHYLCGLADPASPRHPHRMPPGADQDGLARVYVALDEAVARLLRAASPTGDPDGRDVEVTITSDHGSGGSSDKVLYLNRALAEAGLCTLHAPRPQDELVGLTKHIALTWLPPRVREWLFTLGGTALPSWLESKARFGGIDMARSRCFSDELNYMPAVHLNVAGRDPDGQVAPDDIPAVTREIRAALKGLRDPWTGAPVVKDVHRRESLFRGPFVERAPDLLLELHLDAGYTYNLMPTGSAPPGTGPWRRLSEDEWLGRKGRSLPGSHRSHGFYAAAGPSIAAFGETEMHIADATATLLARMGIAVPPEFMGRVLYEALRDTAGDVRALPEAPQRPTGARAGDEAKVEARLRALGYID